MLYLHLSPREMLISSDVIGENKLYLVSSKQRQTSYTLMENLPSCLLILIGNMYCVKKVFFICPPFQDDDDFIIFAGDGEHL